MRDRVDIVTGVAIGAVVTAAAAGVILVLTFVAGLWVLAVVLFVAGLAAGWWLKDQEEGHGGDGFATAADLRKSLSYSAAKKTALATGRSLPRKPAVTEVGIVLGRTDTIWRTPVVYPHRDVTLELGPPQSGKSSRMALPTRSLPGALVTTSSKPDIFDDTAGHRGIIGPVRVFNPEGIGNGVPNNFVWDPIDGCDDFAMAAMRAGYLLSGVGAPKDVSDASFWREQAHRLLRAMLYAAARGGRSMRDVADWANNPDSDRPLRILQGWGNGENSTHERWTRDLDHMLSSDNEKTKKSIYSTLSMTFGFMALPGIERAVLPGQNDERFDVERFLRERGSLYLLGSDRPHNSVAPLFSALTGHIFEEAQLIATRQRRGRLDPPLSIVLDEAAQIAPVPLPRWTADAGGRGISLHIALQAPADLEDRWGRAGGDRILNNSNNLIIHGGMKDVAMAEKVAKLCNEKKVIVKTHSTGKDGARSTTVSTKDAPVMTPGQVCNVPEERVLFISRSVPPVIVRYQPVWKTGKKIKTKRTQVKPTEEVATVTNIVDLAKARAAGDV